METSTDKVPNTSPTAASAASDLNGMAVLVSTHIFGKLNTFDFNILLLYVFIGCMNLIKHNNKNCFRMLVKK